MTVSADPFAPLRSPARPGPGPLPLPSLRSLELAVGRRVEGLLAGDYRSTFAGVGSELWQVRPYQPGDDVRRIEWNVTARTGEAHVRVELAERALVTWIVLDASASMGFGTADRRKADVAEGVAIAVGYAASRRGNRLGIVSFGPDEPVPSLLRRELATFVAAERRDAQPVAAACADVADRDRDACGDVGLAAVCGSEVHRRRRVEQEPRHELALGEVDAHVRKAGARGDVPLDLPHVVSRLVRAQLCELDAVAVLVRAVLAREQPAQLPPDGEVERAQGLER